MLYTKSCQLVCQNQTIFLSPRLRWKSKRNRQAFVITHQFRKTHAHDRERIAWKSADALSLLIKPGRSIPDSHHMNRCRRKPSDPSYGYRNRTRAIPRSKVRESLRFRPTIIYGNTESRVSVNSGHVVHDSTRLAIRTCSRCLRVHATHPFKKPG